MRTIIAVLLGGIVGRRAALNVTARFNDCIRADLFVNYEDKTIGFPAMENTSRESRPRIKGLMKP